MSVANRVFVALTLTKKIRLEISNSKKKIVSNVMIRPTTTPRDLAFRLSECELYIAQGYTLNVINIY